MTKRTSKLIILWVKTASIAEKFPHPQPPVYKKIYIYDMYMYIYILRIIYMYFMYM
jgi:hypothetical protein